MSIDATKSPSPAWQRKAMMAVLAVLVAVVGYLVWTKDLHHSAPASSAPAAASAPVHSTTPTTLRTTPSTTVPGGLPLSSRDPFGN